MGRPARTDVRYAVLDAIASGYDVARRRDGWKASQLARIVEEYGVTAKTVRNAVAELVAAGLALPIDGTGGGYMPTPEGRAALVRWKALRDFTVDEPDA